MEQQQGDNGQWRGNGKTMGNNLEANGREVGEKAGHKSKNRETIARKPGENWKTEGGQGSEVLVEDTMGEKAGDTWETSGRQLGFQWKAQWEG